MKREKMSLEVFTEILNAFKSGDIPKMHMGVRLVAENILHKKYLEDIPEYYKTSLCRKVLRYVAETALKGTFEIDGLSTSCSFCEMENGDPKSFGSNIEWSFDYRGQFINVTIDPNGKEVYYYDKYSKEIWHTNIPQGVHWTQVTGKVDIVSMFEDFKLGRI